MADTSTGFVNGTDFGVYADGTLVSFGLDAQVSETIKMIPTSNKDSGKANTYMPGREDGTISGSSRVGYGAGFGWQDLHALKGTVVTIRFSNDTTGDDELEVDCLLSEWSRSDPDDDSSTLDFTFQMTDESTIVNIV